MQSVMAASDLDYSDQAWLHRACGQTIDLILQQHKVARFLFIESADPDSTAYEVINQAYNKVAARMQGWCLDRYGHAPELEFFKALLVATQWLVHDAIIRGLGEREVLQAKRAAEQLFYGAFSSVATFKAMEKID